MIDELVDLYQQTILDHSKNPRCFGVCSEATKHIAGVNPVCGDEITLHASADKSQRIKLSFEGKGCAICMASASMMTEATNGLENHRAQHLFDTFIAMLYDKPYDSELLGKLVTLEGIKKFPSRIKCATLSWHALHALLQEKTTPISTES
jgi:nitrogen fixation protein NifU and related proteins